MKISLNASVNFIPIDGDPPTRETKWYGVNRIKTKQFYCSLRPVGRFKKRSFHCRNYILSHRISQFVVYINYAYIKYYACVANVKQESLIRLTLYRMHRENAISLSVSSEV